MIGALKGTFKSLVTDEEGRATISFEVADKPLARAIVAELKALPEKKRALSIELDRYRKNRTLEQNALYWKLVQIIANELHCSNQRTHEILLTRYGVSSFLIAISDEDIERLKMVYRVVEIRKQMQVQGKDCQLVRCVVGSSKYNTKQMTTLIDGAFSEIDDMEIDTAEVLSFRNQWGEMRKRSLFCKTTRSTVT